MKNKKAFTLTELLVAMGIVGIIAAMAIPAMMNSINKTMLTANLKGFVQSVKQAADAQLIAKRTKTLEDTDFSNPVKLLENNFDVVRVCDYTNKTCWPDEVLKKYKTLNGGEYELTRQTTALLKNGATVLFNHGEFYDVDDNLVLDAVYGEFYIDLNGDKKPNIVGRDLFAFYISRQAKISPNASFVLYNDYTDPDTGDNVPQLHIYRNNCLSGQPDACFGFIMLNGWRMSY
ncbi:MAG: type II secretion system protein [Cyanobacteria bacterium SIG26]|nr:type II secretion system protein [Cyanobacteria bacterium SIG26]